MNENKGFIRVERKILDDPIIMKDKDYFSIWIYLLLKATHKRIKILFNSEEIILNEGELVTGRKIISEKLSINESKIERVLKVFENRTMIEQLKTKKGRLISIVNWGKYQKGEQQMNNKRTTDEQQVNTNKNETMKELLEERNIYARAREEKLELFDYDWMNDDDEN